MLELGEVQLGTELGEVQLGTELGEVQLVTELGEVQLVTELGEVQLGTELGGVQLVTELGGLSCGRWTQPSYLASSGGLPTFLCQLQVSFLFHLQPRRSALGRLV